MVLKFLRFVRFHISALVIFYLLTCYYGKGDDVESGTSSNLEGYDDPLEITNKALLCFNDKYIYSGCEETCRLKESGNLEVPVEKTEEYCTGACLAETHLVLDCIDGIFSNFLFFNRATLQDVRETIQAGCGYGPLRGNFDVMEHMRGERGNACKATNKSFSIEFSFILWGIFSLML